MKCRKNVKRMSAQEKRRFAEAVMRLKDAALNPGLTGAGLARWDDFANTHLHSMHGGAQWAHGDSAFFPWHREMLFRFEQLIQSQPGYADVTLPYWDWTRERSTADAGFPFTHPFLGVDGTDAQGDVVEREAGAPMPYPHAFDPGNWAMLVKDDAGDPDGLRRAFGERADAPQLPQNDGVVTGVNSSFRSALAAGSYATLRTRSEDIHNLVHRWVGGTMLAMASPNDPVFFLHHAAIDRMWSLWQARNPGLTHYTHNAGLAGHGLNDTLIFHHGGDPAPWAGSATPADVINGHTLHGTGVWYDTDLPEITLETPSVAFADVPEGMTQFRAVRFRVRTGRRVVFRITGAPGGNFGLTPMGSEFPLDPDFAVTDQDALVWVQFTAQGGSAQATSVSIEAFIVDDEGYYAAAEGDEFKLAAWSWSVPLSANVVPRVRHAVALVLDRSGSMAAAAGGGSTRSALLKAAVRTFHELLHADDQISLVSFDDQVDSVLAMTTKSAVAGFDALVDGGGLEPRGDTSIGGGIQRGADELDSAAPDYERAMLVLTDGNENTAPTIATAQAAGDITDRTYAVGFGLASGVSAPKLNEITQNTQGDLIVTGQLASAEERFLLSKVFIQVLAGVQRDQIVLDPQGELQPQGTQAIDFDVSDADLRLTVVALSPLPQWLDFRLRTPDGTVLTPGASPHASYRVGPQMATWQVQLPALPGQPAGSHRGRWQALLGIDKRGAAATHGLKDKDLAALAELLKRGTLPYNLIVQCSSNLRLEARAVQAGFEPGATVALDAAIDEYAVPLMGTAQVMAELTYPDGSSGTLTYSRDGPGRFSATLQAAKPGVTRLRVRATGMGLRGAPFMREKLLTVATYAGGDRPQDLPVGQPGAGADDNWCSLWRCLLTDKVLGPRLIEAAKALDIDFAQLRKCLERHCRDGKRPQRKPKAALATLGLLQRDIAALARRAFADGGTLGWAVAAPPQPVKPPPRPPVVPHQGDHRPFMPMPPDKVDRAD